VSDSTAQSMVLFFMTQLMRVGASNIRFL